MIDIRPALAAVAPHADAAWSAALAAPMASSGVTTPRRVAMFVGQCAVESGGFTALVECLNYSADRLCVVWPNRFIPGSALTASCAADPAALANYVYADRMGNGPEGSGDGYQFRGRGLIQLTGRSAYSRFARSLGKPLDAAFLAWCATPDGAAQSACWFWAANGLNSLSDGWQVTTVTRRINGGLNGLADRLTACNRALAALGAVHPVSEEYP